MIYACIAQKSTNVYWVHYGLEPVWDS